jgi:hypothetical protein
VLRFFDAVSGALIVAFDGPNRKVTIPGELDLTGATVTGFSGDGVTDHGALTGLGDDDHTIYALGNGFFGDGSDGDVTISADTAITRDMFYDNLTVNATKVLDTTAYRVFVRGTLTNNGTVSADGPDGTSEGAGSSPNTHALGTAGNGQSGDTGNGLDASSVTPSLGGDGGAGGASGGNTGGAGGDSGLGGSDCLIPRTLPDMLYAFDLITQSQFQGGCGGGGGAGDGVHAGGNGGAGGNVMVLAARTVINNGIIRVKGGNGSQGAAGNVGGGGGGGGGFLSALWRTWTGNAPTAPGGTGGAARGTGLVGANGAAGLVVSLQV